MIVGHVRRRPLGRAAAETIELAWAATLLGGFSRFHERAKVGAVDKKRSPRVRRLKSRRDPSRDRMLVRPDKVGKLGDRVRAVDFDSAAVIPPSHALPTRLNSPATDRRFRTCS